ncbi:MAG: hypothetical protein K2Q27_13635, partial [Novosphingobium sp.]|nr:hypothetical protein [Novosphingobium sp.]
MSGAIAMPQAQPDRAVGGGTVLAMIAAWLACDQLLLLVYLGIASSWLIIPGLVGVAWLTVLVRRGGAALGR